MMSPNSIRHEAMPSCTVILCTRRRQQKLRRCLDSLRRLRYPEHSVLVIESDAASTESEAIALGYGAGYGLCRRRGLSAARNLGVRMSTSELLAFIDDDAVCEPDWLSTTVPLFSRDRVLAVTGKILFHADGASNSTPVRVFDPGSHVVGRETSDWFVAANFGGLGLGSNFLVRRAAFDLVGWFDERLGRGSMISSGEEHDFLFRIIDAGYRVATCSDCVVRHPIPEASTSKEAFRNISASSSIFTMLAVEHPRHMPQLIRYLWGAIRRKPLPWRERPPQLFDNVALRRIVYSALASGPFIYSWAALRHALSRTPRHTTASR